VRVLEALVDEYPERPDYRLELARAYNGLDRCLINGDRLAEAQAVSARAHAEAEGLHLRHPEAPEYRLELATAQGNMAELHRRNDRLPDARDALVKSRDQARWLAGRWPAVTQYRELLAKISVNLGKVLFELNSLGEAEECYLEARELLEALGRESPTRLLPRRGLAHAWEGLAGVLLAAGKVEEAEKVAGRGVDMRRKIQDDFFADAPQYWQALASARGFHGGILARLGRFREADLVLVEALPLQEKVVEVMQTGRRGEELAVLYGSLAWLRLRQPVAAGTVRELLPQLQRVRALAPPGERFRLTLVGLAHYRLGKWDQSLAALGPSDAATASEGGPCRWTTDDNLLRRMAEHQEEVAPAVHRFCQAMTYHRLGRPVEAVDCYRHGLRLSQVQKTPPGFRSVDLETIRAEAADLLGLHEQPTAPGEKR
jgi:tetratricopeptide (TPR) repeat protein